MDVLCCQGPRTLGYPTINLTARKRLPYDYNARPSQANKQTDGQTDKQTDRWANEHHSATVRSMNASRAKNDTRDWWNVVHKGLLTYYIYIAITMYYTNFFSSLFLLLLYCVMDCGLSVLEWSLIWFALVELVPNVITYMWLYLMWNFERLRFHRRSDFRFSY